MPDSKTIVIQGVPFEFPVKYTEGHTLSDIEAKVLSQTWFENVRNNCAKFIKAAQSDEDEMTMDEATAAINEYAASYEFSAAAAGGSRASLTPEEKEARKIAREAIKNSLAEDGRKISDFKTEEEKEALSAAILEVAEQADVIKLAKKRIKDQQALAESVVASISV